MSDYLERFLGVGYVHHRRLASTHWRPRFN